MKELAVRAIVVPKAIFCSTCSLVITGSSVLIIPLRVRKSVVWGMGVDPGGARFLYAGAGERSDGDVRDGGYGTSGLRRLVWILKQRGSRSALGGRGRTGGGDGAERQGHG